MSTKKPIIRIEKTSIVDNYGTYKGQTYDVPTLIRYCKEQKYPVFEAPLASLQLDCMPWGDIVDMYSFCEHVIRMNNSELKYPIILAPNGAILDGAHRICKAVVLGYKSIKCIRIQEMPSSSGKVDTNNK